MKQSTLQMIYGERSIVRMSGAVEALSYLGAGEMYFYPRTPGTKNTYPKRCIQWPNHNDVNKRFRGLAVPMGARDVLSRLARRFQPSSLQQTRVACHTQLCHPKPYAGYQVGL